MIRTATAAIVLPRRADSPAAFRAFFGRRRLRGSISPTAVNALASAIQTHEGYYPGSPAYVNNNPGNLVYVGQPGATAGAGGFARFSSYDAGLSALKSQINLDAARGTDAAGRPINTVTDLISSWAPSSDPRNNTPAYIAAVANSTGFDPNAPLSSLGSDVPTFTVDVWGSGIDSTSSGAAAPSFSSYDSSGFDLSSVAGSTVDLSAVGLSSSVPWWWLAVAAVGVIAVARR
jgi:hypothetical protein